MCMNMCVSACHCEMPVCVFVTVSVSALHSLGRQLGQKACPSRGHL